MNLLLLLTVFNTLTVFARERVILDVDTAAFVRSGFGVDDDLAVIYALGAKNLHVLGITATYGNTDRDAGIENLRRLLSFTHPKLKKSDDALRIYPGADWSQRNLSQPTEATEFIVATLRKYPKDVVTLLCFGALTNLATVITLYPDVARRLRATVISAGREGAFELNFYAHPEATKLVLEAAIPKLAAVPSTMSGLVISPARILQIENTCCRSSSSSSSPSSSSPSSSPARAICELLPAMNHSAYWHGSLFNHFLSNDDPSISEEGFYPFSLIALMVFANSSLFGQSSEVHMSMNLAPNFLEEPEIIRLLNAPADLARRPLFEELVLEATPPVDVELLFHELVTGLCAAPYRSPSSSSSASSSSSSSSSSSFSSIPGLARFSLAGLLVPAYYGVARFRNLCLVCVLAVTLVLLVAGLFLPGTPPKETPPKNNAHRTSNSKPNTPRNNLGTPALDEKNKPKKE